MKKSGLSVTGLAAGIIATSLGLIMFPLSILMQTPALLPLLGLIAIFMMSSALLGSVLCVVELMTTDKTTQENQYNRSIAIKGLLFSAIPFFVWGCLLILGSL